MLTLTLFESTLRQTRGERMQQPRGLIGKRLRAGCGVVVLAAAMVGAAGCYHPKLINMITAGKDQIKFMYVDQGSHEQGAIRCAVAADGTLSQCAEIAFVFNE